MTADHPIVKALLDSATETLSMMAMLQTTITSVEPWDAAHESLDCMASMGVCGNGEGLIVLSVDSGVCRKIVSAMLGTADDEVEGQLSDGLAELLNMIAGATKTRLAGTDYHFELSIPIAVVGVKSMISRKANVPGALLRLDIEGSPMLIGVWMKGLRED